MSETGISEVTSLEHLRFLYLTRDYRAKDSEGYERIAVFTDGNVWRRPLSQDVYMSSNHRYSASNLLKPIVAQCQELQDNTTGLNVHFLSSSYTSGAQWQEEGAWVDWLRATLRIRKYLPLIYDDKLTAFFLYIVERRSDELVEILQHFWPTIGKTASQCQAVRNEIAHCLVLTADGPTKLKDTTLPYPDLVRTVSLFVGNTTSFSFLKLSRTPAPGEHSIWKFLSDNFGVVGSKNFEFYLEIRVRISKADHQGVYGQCVPRKALEVYGLIHREPDAKADREHGCKRVRSVSTHTAREYGNGSDRWKKIDHCRWDCPPNMKSLFGIRSYYAPLLQENGQMDTIMAFMKEVVGVLNPSQEDIVNELRLQKESTDLDEHLIRELKTFRDNALIFAAGKWYTTPACVWSCKSDISDKIDLSHHYPDMEMIFVAMMGVSTYTLESVYNELQTKGVPHSTTVDEMKRQLWQLNSLLPTTNSKPDPRPILESPVFPVRSPDGSVRLLSADKSDFAIIDRRLDEKRFQVETDERAQESQRNIKSKAYSLCRIATHFGSPRARDPGLLYRLLKNFKVFESPSIKSQWRLTEDGRTWGVDDSEAMIFFDDFEPDAVKIYVPTDASRREICFLYYLPLVFFEWMMDGSSLTETSESRLAIPLIMSVLNTDPSSAELLLVREGIVHLEFLADSESQIQVVGPAEDIAAQYSGKENSSTVGSTSQDSSIKSVIEESRGRSDSEGRRPVTPSTVLSDSETIGIETLASSVISTPTTAVQPQNSNGELSVSSRRGTPESFPYRQRSTSNLLSPQTLHSSHSKSVASQDASTSSRPSTPQPANASTSTVT
ncbi:hypothetical protein GGR58DRAFT_502985 [Xylaria digitata]|nr:hypothetical protein GGR58DRAFT_502985 [Xylaria digitata]